MDRDIQMVKLALEEAIKQQVHGRTNSQQITTVIWTNMAHGRVNNFLNLADEHQPTDYVIRIVQNYERYHHYVQCVQNGDDKIWAELYPKMQQWAYRYLLKKGFFPGTATFELAVSYAGEAGGALVNAHYPYDVEMFDAWAYQILVNVCRRNMRQATSQMQIPERHLVGLDTPELAEFSLTTLEYLSERSLDLKGAFAKLTEREQEVFLWLLTGLSTEEIATRLDITPNHVYHVKHVIIKKLRKILGSDRDDE